MNDRQRMENGSRTLPPRSLIAALTLGAAVLGAWAGPASAAGPPLANSAWPMFHRDLAHTGRADVNGPQTPTVKWIYKNNRRYLSSPSLDEDGTIYYGTVKSLCANEPVNGTLKWCSKLGATIKRSSPAISADGALYIGARDNKLYKVCSRQSCGALPEGSILWTYKVHNDGDVRVSPAIGTDGTIYMAGTFAGEVHAVNPDGSMQWSYLLGDGIINSSPAVAPNGNIYLGLLHAMNSTGTHIWEMVSSSRNRSSSPAIAADGTVYVGSARGLYAANPADGSEKWLYLTPGRVVTTPAIAEDGTIYFGTALRDRSIYALNPDGTLKWVYPAPKNVNASPIIGDDGTIYAAAGKTVLALNPDGTVLWQTECDGNVLASPSIASDGTLYMACGRYLYAYQD